MPQAQLPLFPAGSNRLNDHLAFTSRDGQVTYFNGQLPVFTHAENDLASFRLFTSQLVANGSASPGEIQRAFGVPKVAVQRALARYRAHGAKAFFTPAPPRRGRKLTPEALTQAQALLDQGNDVPAVAGQTDVLANTIHKAIRAGRLRRPAAGFKKDASLAPAIGVAANTQSERRREAQSAPLGCGTTRTDERLLAAVGLLRAAPVQFDCADDVPLGGVLWALPALLSEGLLRHSRANFTLVEGFYPLETIFLVLAFMALVRVRSLEALRYEAPGEWGRLMGLDRVPEVRTLRLKVGELCAPAGAAAAWSGTLAKEWMAAQADGEGVYYADGHVRVYHGGLTALPRRYVARQKLCLRGVTDYWVNAMDGRPFFLVSRPVDAGLIEVLRTTIVPRLIAEAPGQPTAAELEADPLRHRFTLIFDRAGYSPPFFAEMKALRVAIITYHKFPGEDWAAEEFAPQTLTLVHGETVTLALAQRGTRLTNGLWVREVRQREDNGHQVSVLSTDYRSALAPIAVRMFARWTQENFLKYMREHFAIDRLVEHGTEPLPATTLLVNPAWRRLDAEIRRERAQLVRAQAQFAAATLSPTPEPAELEQWQAQKARLHAAVTTRLTRLDELKTKRKATAHHVTLAELPADEQFPRLRIERKHFVDTIKLIAYRAETALVGTVRETLARRDDARALVREILRTTADLRPDLTTKTLTVRLHPLSSALQDAAVRHLADELTATETVFPGTDLRLIFTLPDPA